MTGLPFSKWEAVGNDFVLVDDFATDSVGVYADLASSLCDRHRGVGADGLLVYRVESPERMGFRIFNADGSEDTMCGNGLRCVVSDAFSRQRIASRGTASTLSGPVAWQVGDGGRVSLTLPPPSFEPHRIPTTAPRTQGLEIEGFPVNVVQTGSPHAVVFVPELPDDSLFYSVSPRIETHPWFPERVSVMWACPSSEDGLRLRIWERGVGETRGCGTGACAAAVVALAHGRIAAPRLDVVSSGGSLEVAWQGPDHPVFLSGVARCVFRGRWCG